MPAGQTLAHLRRRFNPMASKLLEAESLSDMSERKDDQRGIQMEYYVHYVEFNKVSKSAQDTDLSVVH